MQHVDPEVLALLALGEQDAASEAEHVHLRSCPQCRAEADELAMVASRARAAGEETLVAPPDHVWDRITAELAPEASAAGHGPVDGGTPATGTDRGAEVVDLASRRRRPVLWGAVAAGVALLAGVGGGVAWERAQSPLPSPAPTPVAVAEADLEALPDWTGSTGRAVVEELPDGEREIQVSLGGTDTSADGYREVWLIAEDLSGMVSLGMLEGDDGAFPVPEGLDLERYSLVDVSEELFDGDPTHSGDSIVRGGLQQA